ncbi:MAG: BACON domain-containing protein [Candidatus Cryptobacteroides sp.]
MKKNTIIGLALLTALVSCNPDYKENWTLSLDYESLKLAYNDVSVPITIYASGSWTVTLEEGIAWAKMDRSEGEGVSTIHLLLEENDGFERSLSLEVNSAGLSKSLIVIQKTAIASPYIEFETASLQCSPQAVDTAVNYSTNIPERYFDKAEYGLEYEGEGGWIENLKLQDECFSFHIQENSGEQIRKATLSYSLEGPDSELIIVKLDIVQEALGGPLLITSSQMFQEWNASWEQWSEEDEVCLGADVEIDQSWEAHEFRGSFDGCGFKIVSSDAAPAGTLFSRVSGAVKNLSFEGRFSATSQEDSLLLAPILRLAEGGVLDNIVNLSTLELTEGEAAYIYQAGICAIVEGGSIKECRNSGRIVNSVAATAASNVAGIAAAVKAPAQIVSCVNETGAAGVIADISSNTSGKISTAGILAYASASVQITDCLSSTDIKKGSKASKFYYAAGILGFSEAQATISGCRNEGRVYSSVKSVYCFLGGILGYSTSYCEIENCTNTAEIFNNGENAQAGGLRIGGIVGAPAPSDKSLLVKACENSGKVYNKSASVSAIHCLGGISGAGNAQGVCIEDCLVDCSISTSASDASLAKMGSLIGRVNIAYNSAYGNGVRGSVGGNTLDEANFSSYLWGSPEGGKAVNVDETMANYYWIKP